MSNNPQQISPWPAGTKVVGTREFKGQFSEDLSFEKDEVMIIERVFRNPHWCIAQNDQGRKGRIPCSYVEKLEQGAAKRDHDAIWFHGKLSRKEAEELLMQREDGLFLIRESGHFEGDYTLSVCFSSKVCHYRVIRTSDSKFTINNVIFFENLTKLVEHHQEKAYGLRTKLERPVERNEDKDQDGDFQRIFLTSNSSEFQKLKALFHRTISQDKAKITLVEKINNDFLLERYKRKREHMMQKLKASNYNKIEMCLFHGTTPEVIDAICKHNFDHRLHGKNGTKYGEGSYFAVNASYSNNYSSGKMTRFMFVAHVLTGEYKCGNESLRRPPLKDPRNPASDMYDSCVNSEDEPTIFVIFNDEQCYPSYLITYNVL